MLIDDSKYIQPPLSSTPKEANNSKVNQDLKTLSILSQERVWCCLVSYGLLLCCRIYIWNVVNVKIAQFRQHNMEFHGLGGTGKYWGSQREGNRLSYVSTARYVLCWLKNFMWCYLYLLMVIIDNISYRHWRPLLTADIDDLGLWSRQPTTGGGGTLSYTYTGIHFDGFSKTFSWTLSIIIFCFHKLHNCFILSELPSSHVSYGSCV